VRLDFAVSLAPFETLELAIVAGEAKFDFADPMRVEAGEEMVRNRGS
jgi:hypothetical protein